MRLLLALLFGMAIGGLAVYFWPQSTQAPVTASTPVPAVTITHQSAPAPSAPLREQPTSFEQISTLRSDFEQTLALYRLMEGKDAQGIVRLLDDARAHLRGGDFTAASAILYSRLAELNPALAVERVLAQPSPAQTSWIHAIFHAWARTDLNAALTAAAALGNPFQQPAGRAILRSRSDLPADALLQIAEDLSIHSPPISDGSDFSTAWQEALARSNPNQQAQGLMRIASTWAASDPQAAMLASEGISAAGIRSNIQSQIAMAWAKQDPAAAVAWAVAQTPTRAQHQLLQGVFQVLAARDLTDAQGRAQQLTGRQQQSAMLGVIGRLAVNDPVAASQWLDEQQAPDLRMQAVQTIAVGMARQDVDTVDAWLATLEPQDAQLADSIVSSMMVQANPQAAAQRVERLEDPEHRSRAADSLVSSWARQDTAAAADWIGSRPREERGALYQSLTAHWSTWDPDAAQQFAEQLPSSAHRDQAQLGLLHNITSFETAKTVFRAISDPEVRQQASAQLYYQFRQSHPQEALRFGREAGVVPPPG